jgi:hypothetical protein
MEPIGPAFPAEPLQYQSADAPTAGVMRVLAWVGIAVGVARLMEAVISVVAYGLFFTSFPSAAPWWERSISSALTFALAMLGCLLLGGCIGLLKRRDWGIALIRFSEMCALGINAIGIVVGLILLGATGRGNVDQLLMSLAYTVKDSVAAMVYPILALTLIHWNSRYGSGG